MCHYNIECLPRSALIDANTGKGFFLGGGGGGGGQLHFDAKLLDSRAFLSKAQCLLHWPKQLLDKIWFLWKENKIEVSKRESWKRINPHLPNPVCPKATKTAGVTKESLPMKISARKNVPVVRTTDFDWTMSPFPVSVEKNRENLNTQDTRSTSTVYSCSVKTSMPAWESFFWEASESFFWESFWKLLLGKLLKASSEKASESFFWEIFFWEACLQLFSAEGYPNLSL